MKQKILGTMICLCMILGLITGVAQAVNTPETTTIDGEVYYQLDSAEDLDWFAAEVNGGNNAINAVLTADIDYNPGYTFNSNGTVSYGGAVVESGWKEWTPIGSGIGFIGVFDGAGHSIGGLNSALIGKLGLQENEGATDQEPKFLPGYVRNVGVVNSYISSSWGAVVSSNCSGTVDHCYNAGTVRGTYLVGGVVGYNSEGGIVSNCYNEGDVIGPWIAGGVVGQSYHSDVINCYNTGNVGSNEEYSSKGYQGIGGIVGVCEGGSDVVSCYNHGMVNGKSCVGGVVGSFLYFNGSGEVVNSYNAGTVSGSGSAIGGIAGSSRVVRNCYNLGAVSGGSNVGGISGGVNYESVINSYNLGEVKGTTNVGAIVGTYSYPSIDAVHGNCYYDNVVFSGSAVGKVESSGEVKIEYLAMPTSAFASGEVAYLLQNNMIKSDWMLNELQNWGQNLSVTNADTYPVLNGATVYQVLDCAGNTAYSNMNANLDHCYEKGVCTICGDIYLYQITVGSVSNGTVSVDLNSAAVGTTINIVVTPAEGYELESMKIVDAAGNGVALGGGNQFIMPASNVTINATFSVIPTEPSTEVPTEESTEPVTVAPTEESTEPSTEIPTEEHTAPSTEAPTEESTEPSTEAPTEESTEPSMEAPTEESTEANTESSTEENTESATESPEPTTEAEGESENKLQINVSVKDNIAEVEAFGEDVLEHLKQTDKVEINLRDTDAKIEMLQLSVEVIGAIAEVAKEDQSKFLVIEFSEGTVEFDNKVLNALSEQANGEDVCLVLNLGENVQLSSEQQEAIKELDSYAVVEAYWQCADSNTRISDFKGGVATLSIPFTVPEGQEADEFTVVYLAEDGSMEKLDTRYEDGKLVWEVGHFSDFVVMYESVTVGASNGGNMFWIVLLGAVAVIGIGAGVFFWKCKIREVKRK